MVADEEEGTIRFLAKEKFYEKAAKPVPASNCMPEWFKNLDFTYNPKETAPPGAPIPEDASEEEPTVRSCMSFLDALTMGWIVPMPFDLEVEMSHGGKGMALDCAEDFTPAHPHALQQLGRENHPELPKPVIKFRTPWTIKTPEGVSVLITSPMNRSEDRFSPFSGVIESDTYFSNASIPSLWEKPDYSGVIEAGTPLFQVIPFDRDGIVSDGVIRTFDPAEERKKDKFAELIENTQGTYRDSIWQPKGKSRVAYEE